MEILPLVLYLCELAFVGLILYFIPLVLPMPDWAKTTAQILLVVIFVIAAINAVIGGARRVPLSPVPTAPSSIIR